MTTFSRALCRLPILTATSDVWLVASDSVYGLAQQMRLPSATSILLDEMQQHPAKTPGVFVDGASRVDPFR